MKKLFPILAISIAMTACSTYKNTYRLNDIPDTRAKVTQVVVDVEPDFSKRIKGESYPRMRSINAAKENAYYNAIKTNNVDVLVDPIYEIKTTGRKHTASVTGFAGTYKNARTLSVEEQNNFNQNLENFKKFLTLDAVVKEDNKSVYILNNAGAGCNGASSVTEKEVKNTADLVTRYNNFVKQRGSDGKIADEFKDAKLEEPKKRKSILGGLLGF